MTESTRGMTPPDDAGLDRGLATTQGSNQALSRLRRAVFDKLFADDDGPTTIGRYVVQTPIGAGGMGKVFAAYDAELDRNVALKLLHHGWTDASDGEAKRLLREAQAMARLSHPNVVQVHDAGTHDGLVFIAMELVRGQTLRQWQSGRARSWRETVALFLEAGRGLVAAHKAGLVHRDFKPENVLVDGDGRPRVADFGLVRAEGGAESPAIERPADSEPRDTPLGAAITRQGSVLGTPAYMSPEQHVGQPLDASSDQFSFCVALYEALYGQMPFAGDTHAELMKAVLAGEVRKPKRIAGPRALLRAIRRGLSVEPRRRFASMDALLAALGRATRPRVARWVVVAIGLTLFAPVALGVLTAMFLLRAPDDCAGFERAQALGARMAGPVKARLATMNVEPRWVEGPSSELVGYLGMWGAEYSARCKSSAPEDRVMTLCLERELQKLEGVVDVLSEADESIARNVPQVMAGVFSNTACADDPPLPSLQAMEAASSYAARPLRVDLARAGAFWHAGEPRAATQLAMDVAKRAGDAEIPLLEGEALVLAHQVQLISGPRDERDTSQIRSDLRRAEALALTTSDRVTVARAKVLLAHIPGDETLEAGRAALDEAERVATASGDPEAQWMVLRLKMMPFITPDVDERKAIALRFEELPYFGPGHIFEEMTADAVANAGLRPRPDADELAQRHEQNEKMFGADSARAAQTLLDQAKQAAREGHHPRAEERFQRAGELLQQLRGPTSTEYAEVLREHARTLLEAGELARALAMYDKAIAALADNPPRDHNGEDSVLASTRYFKALVLRRMGRFDDARAQAEQAHAEYRQTRNPDLPDIWAPDRCLILYDAGAFDEALACVEAAHNESSTRVGAADRTGRIAGLDLAQGATLVAVDRADEALAILEGAVAALDTRKPSPYRVRSLATARLALAEAIHKTGGDRARAKSLAKAARAAWAEPKDKLSELRLAKTDTLLAALRR